MSVRIDPALLYGEQAFFLDYVARRTSALRLVEREPDAFAEAASARRSPLSPCDEIAEALRVYNRRLGASLTTLEHVERLREPTTLCVVGGHQAGFLGGPLFAVYKALSVLRAARYAEETLGVPVVPLFWLATEDHDFTEINRARFLEPDGALRTVSFDWPDRGRPIEKLPITAEVRRALDEALPQDSVGTASSIFRPAEGDDYASWHARIWLRLFADDGLVLVEPRTVRRFSGPFFRDALERADEIARALRGGRDALASAGYDAPLDPDRAGRPFVFGPSGERVRVDDPSAHIDIAARAPERYSADAALRPLLVDRLFPTIGSVLGPTELTYHAMLHPVYSVFDLPQPVLLPRAGYTLLDEAEAHVLERLGLSIDEALAPDVDSKAVLRRAASPEMQRAFDAARRDLASGLAPLRPLLTKLDPGLESRWHQTADHAGAAIDRLEERAVRADLARAGLSAGGLHALLASLRPTGRPQERVLSFAHAAARFGVEWVRRLPGSDRPDRFAHFAVTIQGGP